MSSESHFDDAVNRRLAALEEANRRLERQGRRRRYRGACALAGLLVLAIGGAAAHTYSTVEGGEFVLRDKAGAVRAALAMRPDGTPGLALFDRHGQTRLVAGPDRGRDAGGPPARRGGHSGGTGQD